MADMEGAVEILRGVFPDYPQRSLRVVLEAHGNDVHRSVEYLLAEPPPHSASVSNTSTSDDLDDTADSSLDDDHDAEDVYPARRRSARPDDDPHHSPALSAQLEIVHNIKEIVLPGLADHLSQLHFPDLTHETDRVKYSLRALRVTSLDLHPDNVHLDLAPRHLDIRVRNLSVDLHVGAWAFQRKTLPRLRDSGTAHVTLREVSAALKMVPRGEDDAALAVVDPEVEVAAVRLRFGESRASALYNAVSLVLRPVLKAAAERVLADNIVAAVEEQVEDWSTWMAG